MPNANVTITNTGTNAVYKTKTTAVGQFSMPYLEAGTYSVEVTAPGFANYRETDMVVATDQTVRINVNLRLGAVGEQVEVTAQAVQIQTDSTQVSNATTSAVINDIPNVTQNPLYYAMLQNGVQPRNETSSSTVAHFLRNRRGWARAIHRHRRQRRTRFYQRYSVGWPADHGRRI